MSNLVLARETATDYFGSVRVRSPRQELQEGYRLYMDKFPVEACDGLMQRRGWWQGLRDEAIATTPVVAQ